MGHLPSDFGGIAGQASRAALRRSSWIAGMALTSALFLMARGLGLLELPELFPPLAAVLVFIGLAYHATAEAGFQATVGRTVFVGLQVAMASALWLVPWMLWSYSRAPGAFPLEFVGTPTPLAAGAYVFCCLVATPALLIAAAHSQKWFDVVSPAHWSRQFRGRSSDLMMVYTIQTGGLVLTTALSIPFVALALRWNMTAGLAAVSVAVCNVLGFWVALAGRLCGSIHQAAAVPPDRPAAEPSFDDGLEIAGPALVTSVDREIPEQCTNSETVPEETTAAEQTRSEAAGPDESESNPTPVHPCAEENPADVSEEVKSRHYPAPANPVSFKMPKPSKEERKTPLLDAETRVVNAMKRFRLDPSHTLSRLAGLTQRFAPNPHVLQAMTICLHRTGHVDQALTAARQAFPLCFEHGLASLAAAMFYELRGQLHKLELKQEQVLVIAEVLHKADELATAAKAYSLVIHGDGGEFRAITGLLDVAERILEQKRKPEAALKVYTFLLEHVTDSGMTEVVREAISRCQNAEETAQPTA